MCDCLNFLLRPWRMLWHRIYVRWRRSSFRIVPAQHVQLLNAINSRSPRTQRHRLSTEVKSDLRSSEDELWLPRADGNGFSAIITQGGERINLVRSFEQQKTKAKEVSHDTSHRSVVSLFTKRGQKGINQDAMLLIEDFASRAGTIFCGVFDGHGPHGHLVAKNVGDILPRKLASCWQSVYEAAKRLPSSSPESHSDGTGEEFSQDWDSIDAWKDSLVKAYKLMDRELLLNDRVDCVSSGTTAVTLVKQGYDLILGNVGDSRAILGSTAEDGSLVAIQLTVDLKPNVPREAERIRRLKGRVFALRNEPYVKRVWLPNLNAPGLAMTRALGDYCLKNHGVIAEPEVTHRRLTHKDKFIVLATDGVWDVLSNEQVVEMVAMAPVKSSAGKAVVDAAVRAWKSNYANSKVDDCAVICLFFNNFGDTS
eukprot:c21063_g2_i1 orf=279-1550(-)